MVATALVAFHVPEAAIVVRAGTVEAKQLCLWIYMKSKFALQLSFQPSGSMFLALAA